MSRHTRNDSAPTKLDMFGARFAAVERELKRQKKVGGGAA